MLPLLSPRNGHFSSLCSVPLSSELKRADTSISGLLEEEMSSGSDMHDSIDGEHRVSSVMLPELLNFGTCFDVTGTWYLVPGTWYFFSADAKLSHVELSNPDL